MFGSKSLRALYNFADSRSCFTAWSQAWAEHWLSGSRECHGGSNQQFSKNGNTFVSQSQGTEYPIYGESGPSPHAATRETGVLT